MSTVTSVGLFLVRWDIGSSLPGAPTFVLSGTVDTVRNVFNGSCRLSQAIHPPPDFASQVQGTVSYLTVMPDQTHILLVATGTTLETLPPPAIGTLILTNFELRMILADDWKTGVAHVRYLFNNQWHDLENVPVRIDPVSEIPQNGGP
jgi:hypothetical protein